MERGGGERETRHIKSGEEEMKREEVNGGVRETRGGGRRREE